MKTIVIQHYSSPYGELVLGSFGKDLVLCDWQYRKMRSAIDQRILSSLAAEFVEGDSPVIQQAIRELNEYFKEDRTQFDVPYQLVGTPFQQQVWLELIKIPYGQTTTYSKLSKKLNNEKAIRAIAAANGANALSIIVPCHRVIGSDNQLVGYAGGLTTKRKLLELEKCPLYAYQPTLF